MLSIQCIWTIQRRRINLVSWWWIRVRNLYSSVLRCKRACERTSLTNSWLVKVSVIDWKINRLALLMSIQNLYIYINTLSEQIECSESCQEELGIENCCSMRCLSNRSLSLHTHFFPFLFFSFSFVCAFRRHWTFWLRPMRAHAHQPMLNWWFSSLFQHHICSRIWCANA